MTSVVEDYVKTIYGHTEWQPDPITPSALAERLGLAASSVTEMVKKLAAQGLVSHRRYGAITLTDAGLRLALRMVRRHRLVETWLVREYGYSWDEVHDEAEVLEHAFSDRLLDAIDAKLGNPTVDPHGDPIPTADGRVLRPDAVLIRDAEPGARVRVARVSDRDPLLLRHLAAENVTVGRELLVRDRDRHRDALTVRLVGDGEVRELGAAALRSIWVTRLAQ